MLQQCNYANCNNPNNSHHCGKNAIYTKVSILRFVVACIIFGSFGHSAPSTQKLATRKTATRVMSSLPLKPTLPAVVDASGHKCPQSSSKDVSIPFINKYVPLAQHRASRCFIQPSHKLSPSTQTKVTERQISTFWLWKTR